MNVSLRGILFIVLGLVWASPATANLYAYVDTRGSVHYTNVPTDVRAVPLGRFTLNCRNKRTRRQPPEKKLNHRTIERHIIRFARQHRVDPLLVKAIIKTESDFDPRAVSRQGAKGLMQLMPATARELEVTDPFDPYENIKAGTRYLRLLLDIFQGDIRKTLAAYNAGPGRVAKCRDLPAIPETMQYVQTVLAHYRSYRRQRVIQSTRITVRQLVTIH